MREQTRKWWGKLTDEELERIGGKAERLADTLQDKYGYTRGYLGYVWIESAPNAPLGRQVKGIEQEYERTPLNS